MAFPIAPLLAKVLEVREYKVLKLIFKSPLKAVGLRLIEAVLRSKLSPIRIPSWSDNPSDKRTGISLICPVKLRE